MDYITKVLNQVKEKNADQPEFIQAVEEVFRELKTSYRSSSRIRKTSNLRKIS